MVSIKQLLKKSIIKSVPDFISRDIVSKYKEENSAINIHYSQEGEDIILERLLANREKGFYVDIGAHHPVRFSNTYLFYLKGWKGLNIDASPGSMAAFMKMRPNDINIEAPISDLSQELKFYIFHESALNTFNEKLANSYIASGWKLSQTKTLITKTLGQILEANGIKNEIDFLSIDVEGFELNVLRSMNWNNYSPGIILIEDLEFNFQHLEENEIYSFLVNKGYRLIAKTFNTVFYQKMNA